MGKPYAKCCIYAHYKPGAVCAVCQTCPAIYIRVTHKLACIVCNCLSTSAAWRSIAPAFPWGGPWRWTWGAAGTTGAAGAGRPWSFLCCLTCSFLCCLTFFFFFLKARFFFFLRFSYYIIGAAFYEIAGYPSVPFFNCNFYPSVFFFHYAERFTLGNLSKDIRLCAGIRTDIQIIGCNVCYPVANGFC